MRERSLGSYWIGWLGMIGAAAHALAAPLVVALEVEWAGILFPFIMLVALWALSAAVWPARAPSPTVA
jgi:membrane protein implicated in regulation of membrane protease activity